MSRVAAALMLLALLLAGAPAGAEEGLGRLFTSPAERARLDAQRARAGQGESVQAEPQVQPEPEPQAEAPPPEVPGITVNGIVRRSDGRAMAWVNGQSTLSGDFDSQHFQVRTGKGDSVRVITPEHLPDVELRPGESFQPGELRIVDPRSGTRPAGP